MNTAATIRLPSHMVGLLNKWRRTERLPSRSLGRPPILEEIAGSLNLSSSQLAMVRHALKTQQVQHDAADPEGWRISGGVTDHRAAAEHTLENREEERHVLNRLDLLEERERTVITLRFGLDGERPHTLNEIGLRLGITREWVRKIEQKAVRKLDPKYANILTVQSNRRPHAGPA